MFRLFASLALAAAVALPGAAFAHSAIFDCFDNGDAKNCHTLEEATPLLQKIKDAKGDVLRELKLDSNSEVSFPKPEGEYKVMFDGGEGHSVELDGKKIVQ